MDEDDGAPLAPFPQPPAFLWTQFTDDRVEQLAALRDEHTGSLPDLPPDLQVLQPPPPPPTGRWRVFGQLSTLAEQLPSLEGQNIERLGPSFEASSDKDAHANKLFELKKLSKSLLLNFLELIGILSIGPGDAADKIDDLQTIFYNMHQHINEWRAHQTREALIAMLQAQLERTRNETRTLQEAAEGVRQTLVRLSNVKAEADDVDGAQPAPALKPPTEKDVRETIPKEADRQQQQDAWATLDAMFT